MPVDETKTNPKASGSIFLNSTITEYDEIIKCSAQKERVHFLEIYQPLLEENYQIMLSDGLHPNKKGYDYMFDKIKNFLYEKNLLGK
jgi:lysophospholipase L1-like esterase